MNHPLRREKVAADLREPGLDALVVSSDVNVRYLTGFTGGGNSYFIVNPRKMLLVSDGRFPAQIADECPDVATHIRPLGETTTEALAKVIQTLGVRKVGFEADHLTVSELEKLKDKAKSIEWVSTSGFVEKQRKVKEAAEVAAIRAAIAVAEDVYAEFRTSLRPSDTEFEMTDRIESLTRKHGGRATSFEPITAVGERSALAHAPATSRILGSGAWLLLDWGAVAGGYVSDLTRMLIPHTPLVRSEDAPKFDRAALEPIWQAVLAGRAKALEKLWPGVATKDVDAAARAAIEAAGYGDKFTHSLGHGIGLLVHEGPNLRSNSDEILAAGNVVTVEPGIYVHGWGGVRIEDDVLVTEDGPVLLSTLNYDLDAALV